jgi:hypothetical protein
MLSELAVEVVLKRPCARNGADEIEVLRIARLQRLDPRCDTNGKSDFDGGTRLALDEVDEAARDKSAFPKRDVILNVEEKER